MDLLHNIFPWVCGQARCFEVDGQALPVCQRCLGLYVGSAVAAAWLLLGGAWRRGLPSMGVFVVHIAVLVAAMLGGLHVLDFGPAWRMTCGLWTGMVVVLWLTGAGTQLRLRPAGPLPWRRADKIGAIVLAAAMPPLAAAFAWLARLGWTFWTALTILGTLALAASVLWALLGLLKKE